MAQHQPSKPQDATSPAVESSQTSVPMDRASTEQDAASTIAIEFYIDDSNPPLEHFSNNFGVTEDAGIFHLTFAQAAPPVVSRQEDIDRIRQMPRRAAPIVARIAVPAASMQLYLDLATAQWNTFVLSQQQGDYRTIERENQVAGEGDNQ